MKALACTVMLLSLSSTAFADEGMWTFDNFPKQLAREKLGVEVTDAWLDKVRLATTRLESGCTGSFISADGLMLTNHHCASECLAQLSTAESDLLANGFLAGSREQEKRCPTEQASVLTATEDITSKVAGVTKGLSDKAANEARKKELTRLEQACEEASKRDRRVGALSCESVSLYNGGQYFLYKYKRYDDLRMVFAPESDIAAFGGDPDNFQFPRYCLDMSIMRVYQDGKPLKPPSHLQINFAGPQENEPVFVSGHPGSTDRLLTVEELVSQRNVLLPIWLLRNSELRGRLIQFGKVDAESLRIVQDPLNSIENSIKVRRKELDALLDDNLMASKRRDEQALRGKVAADAELASVAGSAWDDMAKSQQAYRNQYVPYAFIESGAGFNSDLYRFARRLVRAAAERAKPNEERLREYTDSALPQLEQQIKAATPVYPSLEKRHAVVLARTHARVAGARRQPGQGIARHRITGFARGQADRGLATRRSQGARSLVGGRGGSHRGFQRPDDPPRAPGRSRSAGDPQALRGRGRGAQGQRERKDRSGPLQGIGHQHLPRCDFHAAAQLRQRAGLDREG